MSNNQKIHFRGLNSLRFFAAYLVLLHHGETIRAKNGLFNLEHYSFFRNGSLAVSFFFVLSGFLITYLLLNEKKTTGNINLKNFYLRRVYRIFPLYYLLVIIGLIVIPVFLNLINYQYTMPYDTFSAGVLFLFFLSFVVNPLYGSHLLEPLWSIGVEEYFYLIWAPLFKFFGSKTENLNGRYPLKVIGLVMGVKTLIMLFFYFYTNDSQVFNVFKDVLLSLKFELMAVGGLGAYWVFKNNEWIKKEENTEGVAHSKMYGTLSLSPIHDIRQVFFFKPIFQVLLLIMIVTRLFCFNYFTENPNLLFTILFQTPVLSVYTEGVLFLWLILNVSINPIALFKLDIRFLEKLGEISYGIYMYQMLVIFGVVLLFKKTMISLPPIQQTVFYYLILTIGVLSISFLSKKFFEDYFLKFKRNT